MLTALALGVPAPTWGEDFSDRLLAEAPPPRQSHLTGELVRPELEIYDKAEISSTGDTAVLYALRLPTGHGDEEHEVVLALLDPAGKRTASLSLTRHIPVYLEAPGIFLEARGLLRQLATPDGLPLLHVSVFASLSGTGGQAGAVDLFARVGDGEIDMVTLLPETERYSSIGFDEASGKTSILCGAGPEPEMVEKILQVIVSRQSHESRETETTCTTYLHDLAHPAAKPEPGGSFDPESWP